MYGHWPGFPQGSEEGEADKGSFCEHKLYFIYHQDLVKPTRIPWRHDRVRGFACLKVELKLTTKSSIRSISDRAF